MHGDIYTLIEGALGILVLNRPQALNAFNLPMVEHCAEHLARLQDDDRIAAVAVRGTGHRAFCAGGDVRSLYEAKRHQQPDLLDKLFRTEYRLNYTIQQFTKPYIAVIEGIAMGGGIGMSIHGSHRIVCETSLLAMPETAIGFFPDIGASYFLNRCPGALGTFLGLTGYRMNAADALYAGWATHYIPCEKLKVLWHHLQTAPTAAAMEASIESLNERSPPTKLPLWQEVIDACFSADSVSEIFQRLAESPAPQAREWLATLRERSPTSLVVTLALLRRNRGVSLKEALTIEFRLSQRFMQNHDFFEGVRAVLVDKDQQPCWQPESLEAVDPLKVEQYFAPFENQAELFQVPKLDEH
jgi:enoyl-CoA hydratase/carnithine racemase